MATGQGKASLGVRGPKTLCQRPTWPRQVLPPAPSAGPVGGCTGHDVTAGWGAPADLHPAEESRPAPPVPSLLPGSRRDFLFFAEPRVSQGGGCRRVTRHAAWGRGRRRQSRGPGAEGPAPAPHPSGSRAPRPAPPALGRRRSSLPGPGRHPGRRPPGPQPPAARTHAGPQPPGARPARTYPGAAVGAARSPAAAAAGARPSAAPRPWPRRRGAPAPGRTRGPTQAARRRRSSAPSRAASPRAGSAFLAGPLRPCRRRSPRRRGRRACRAGPGAHGAPGRSGPRAAPWAQRAEGRADGLPRAGPDAPACARSGPAQGPSGLVCGPPPTLSPCRGPTCPGKVPAATVGLGPSLVIRPTAPGHLLCPRGSGLAQRASRMLAGRCACAALRTTSLASAERPAPSKPQCGYQATEGLHSAPSVTGGAGRWGRRVLWIKPSESGGQHPDMDSMGRRGTGPCLFRLFPFSLKL